MIILTSRKKTSLLVGVLALFLLFSPGQASAKSGSATLHTTWQTEALHRTRHVSAIRYFQFVPTRSTGSFPTDPGFAERIHLHTLHVSLIVKSNQPRLVNNLLTGHHTYLKIAADPEAAAEFIA